MKETNTYFRHFGLTNPLILQVTDLTLKKKNVDSASGLKYLNYP